MSTFPDFVAIANSQFASAVIGSLAGAFAGAYAADRVATRARLREDIRRELRTINTAIALSAGVASSAFNLKSQHVRDIYMAYVSEKERFSIWTKKPATGEIQGDAPFELKCDFRTAPTLSTPVDALSNLIYGNISATGRPVALCAALVAATQNFNVAISQRNQLIQSFKSGDLPEASNLIALYLGLPYAGGHVNQEFGDYLAGLSSYLDDALFFSTQLCADLTAHGQDVIDKYKQYFRGRPLSVTRTDFSQQQAAGLLPDRAHYQSWFTGFQKQA